MAQPAHPQPQDAFPFLLPRTMPAMTAATAITKIKLMMIVAIFSISHVNIEIPPFLTICFLGNPVTLQRNIVRGFVFHSYYGFTIFTFLVSFVASLYGLNSI